MVEGKDGRVYPERRGSASASWRGGRQTVGNGRIHVVVDNHPRADSRGRVYEHVIVAEKALGHYLPEAAEVHHRDQDTMNNDPSNLVICQDHEYHMLLHRRLRAYRACGRADWLKCVYCGKWDNPTNMYVRHSRAKGPNARHRACHAAAMRKGAS